MPPDYYELLGLESGADRSLIEAALQARQGEWLGRAREAVDGRRYLALLEQIPGLRQALLSTDEARVAYDRALRESLAARRVEALDELQRLVRLRGAKGGLTVSDRALLRAEAERLEVGRGELERLVEVYPPLPEAPAEAVDDDGGARTDDVLDAAARAEIGRVLAVRRRRDLYDVLDLPRDAPDEEIGLRIGNARQHAEEGGGARLAEDGGVDVIGVLTSYLGTPEARRRYDRTLVREAEDALRERAGFALKGLSRLDGGTHEVLRQEGAALGIVPERAERLIRGVCRRDGVVIESAAGVVAALESRKGWLRCRRCCGLTDLGWAEIHTSGACRHCQGALQWDCPVCKRQYWVDEPRCRCGFRLVDLVPMVQHFEAAQRAFRMKRYGVAVDHLRRVQRMAPRHVGARKGLEKLQAQIGEIRRLKGVFAVERSGQRLVAARAVLEHWGRLVSPGEPVFRAALEDVTRRLAEAEALTARGREQVGRDPAEARVLYRRALVLATDLPEALDGLRRCPPDGPSALFAEARAGRVMLRWSAPAVDEGGAIAYRVIRKRGEAPAHAEDGTVVAEVEGTEWEDGGVTRGEAYGYAVFARREGVSSITGVSSGPFVVVDEVKQVRVESARGLVRLAWTLPEGAVGARVVRKRGMPVLGPHDPAGVVVEAGRDGVEDRGLEDGRVYHYGVYALYRTGSGRAHASAGVAVSAVPGEPPGVVTDLRIEAGADGQPCLRWTPPDVGRVRVVRTERPLMWVEEELRPAAELSGIEGEWLADVRPGVVVERGARGGASAIAYLTPVTVHAGQAAVGGAVVLARIEDPRGLRVERSWEAPSTVWLRWQWAEGAGGARARVEAREGRHALGPEDGAARMVVVSRDEYAQRGYATMELPPGEAGPWYVVVYSEVEVRGQTWHSPGIEPGARAIVPEPGGATDVWYTIERPKVGGRDWRVRLRTEPPGAEIGPTVLVAQRRYVPLGATEGQVVARFGAARDGERMLFRPAAALDGQKMRLWPDPEARGGHGPAIGLCLPDEGSL